MALLDDEGMVGSELSERAINNLQGMSNWMLFPAFLGVFISSIALIGLFSGIVVLLSFALFAQSITAEALGMLAAFLFYGLIFGLLFGTSFFLMRSASQNKEFVKQQEMSQLEKAFASKRKFWIFLGISLFLLLLLIVFIIVVLFFIISD